MFVFDACTESWAFANRTEAQTIFGIDPTTIPTDPGVDGENLRFVRWQDRTVSALYLTSLGFPRTPQHDALDEWVAAGGVIRGT